MTNKNQKACRFCNSSYDNKKHKSCPHCGFREPLQIGFWFIFLLIVFTSLILYFANNGKYFQFKQEASFQNSSDYETNFEEIKLRPLSNLSYLSKDEIFAKRTDYVKNSIIFSNKPYKPNKDVYQIEDKLPWISADKIAKYGLKNNPDIANGFSRHSISINNPEILISFIVADYSTKKNKKYNKNDYLLPKKAFWNSKNKTIKVYFDYDAFSKINPDFSTAPMFIDETNARDMGFNWILADETQGITFENITNNISIRPYKIKGCYKKGNGCGLKQGCNNYSPYQEEMIFRILNKDSYMKIKMWKNKPKMLNKKPDIIYEMYFQ